MLNPHHAKTLKGHRRVGRVGTGNNNNAQRSIKFLNPLDMSRIKELHLELSLEERKNEIDLLVSKLIKDSQRGHKRPIDSKIITF